MDRGLTILVERESSFVGGVLSLPDANPALHQLDGQMGPIRLVKFMWARRRLDKIRVADVVGRRAEDTALRSPVALKFLPEK